MLKILYFLFSVLFSFSVYADFTNCEYEGNVTQYSVTMTSARICADYSLTTGACTGSNDFLVGTESKTCDIASVAANNDVCTYGSLSGMPIGETYNYVRVSISRDMTLKATITPTASDADVIQQRLRLLHLLMHKVMIQQDVRLLVFPLLKIKE